MSGKSFVTSPPPAEQRRPLLNEIWKQVTLVTDAPLYLEIAKVYVEFVSQHFGERELNLVLADVVRHAAKERSNSLLQGHLAECALGVLRHNADFVRIISLETFLPLVDLLQGACQVKRDLLLGQKRPTVCGLKVWCLTGARTQGAPSPIYQERSAGKE